MKVFLIKVAALMAFSILTAVGASYAEGGPTLLSRGEEFFSAKCAVCHGDKGAHAEGGPIVVSSGEELFNAKCAGCHGYKGAGAWNGPPLVHKIYHPNHHADFSFRRAVSMGVKAHHWQFGDMKKVEGLSAEDVDLIIEYVRSIQREAGIF